MTLGQRKHRLVYRVLAMGMLCLLVSRGGWLSGLLGSGVWVLLTCFPLRSKVMKYRDREGAWSEYPGADTRREEWWKAVREQATQRGYWAWVEYRIKVSEWLAEDLIRQRRRDRKAHEKGLK